MNIYNNTQIAQCNLETAVHNVSIKRYQKRYEYVSSMFKATFFQLSFRAFTYASVSFFKSAI